MGNWQYLSIPESKKLNDSVNVLHRAAQFVAMFSNSYLPNKPDDSQNCLFWNHTLGRMEGRWIEDLKIRMALDVRSFELIVEYKDSDQRITLDKRTRKEVNRAVLEILRKTELNIYNYEPIRHFIIPQHAIEEAKSFSKPENIFLEEWSRYLSNTQLILRNIATRYGSVSEICVWPHHFDIAILVRVNSGGNENRSIGMGLSIADSYVDEPYFYINNLDADAAKSEPRNTPRGKVFWNTKDWTGLVLPASAVAGDAAEHQQSQLKSFFMTAWMHFPGYVANM